MSTSAKNGPISGAALRGFRAAAGLTQADLASALGVRQASVSLMESGQMGMSAALAERLWARFDRPADRVRLGRFLGRFEAERRRAQPLVGHPEATYTTLTVWELTEDLDLAAEPADLRPVGLVTCRLPQGGRAIALSMPSGSDAWEPGEVVVYVSASLDGLQWDDLCLVQPSVEVGASLIVARFGGASRNALRRTREFIPLWPKNAKRLPARTDQTEGAFRAVYRARYTPGIVQTEGQTDEG